MDSDSLAPTLLEAKTAIERGNYPRAVALLEPLCASISPLQPQGDVLRLLLATALMGQGEGERAAACCRSLESCGDPQRRAQARQLLQVLEAPALRRPRDWSLTLPRLDQAPPLEGWAGNPRSSGRAKPAPPAPPPPPVGETRSPRGFIVLVVVVLLALVMSSLLSGCMRVETELAFSGPGRLHLQHRLEPVAGTPLPFQRRLAATLASQHPPYRVREDGAATVLASPLLTPTTAAASLRDLADQASALVGVDLPPPLLEWRETNWLIGVRQRIRIDLDLQSLPRLPGLNLRLRLTPLPRRAIRAATPLAAEGLADARAVVWPLRLGERNTLELRCWRWNPLGIGGLAVGAALLLVVLVQRMRVRLGLGLPELPA